MKSKIDQSKCAILLLINKNKNHSKVFSIGRHVNPNDRKYEKHSQIPLDYHNKCLLT